MKICECKDESALYRDMWVVCCQYCWWRIVNEDRIKKYVEYNTIDYLWKKIVAPDMWYEMRKSYKTKVRMNIENDTTCTY